MQFLELETIHLEVEKELSEQETDLFISNKNDITKIMIMKLDLMTFFQETIYLE